DHRIDAAVEQTRDEEGEADQRRGEQELARGRLLIAVLQRPGEEEAHQRHDAELAAEEQDALARRHRAVGTTPGRGPEARRWTVATAAQAPPGTPAAGWGA